MKPREHLPRVVELEQVAAGDRRFLYDGLPWTVGGFRDYFRTGMGLVALNRDGTVLGFACYHLSQLGVEVPKLVAPLTAVEEALLRALWKVKEDTRRQFVNLPMVLNLGTALV